MRKTLAIGIAALVLAPAANADTPGCVSLKEYRKVERGFSIHRVHNIFDTRGAKVGGSPGMQIRHYAACGDWSESGTVEVWYERENGVWKLTRKYR